jgi:hypothetical protein
MVAAGGTSAAVWDEPRERWLPLRPALEHAGAGYDILGLLPGP